MVELFYEDWFGQIFSVRVQIQDTDKNNAAFSTTSINQS